MGTHPAAYIERIRHPQAAATYDTLERVRAQGCIFPAEIMQQPTVFHFDVLQLDDHATHTYKDRLGALAEAAGSGELHLDFTQVEWISSTALSMLIGLHRRMSRSEGHLVLANVGQTIVDLFRLTRLDTLLDIRAVRQDAPRSVSATA